MRSSKSVWKGSLALAAVSPAGMRKKAMNPTTREAIQNLAGQLQNVAVAMSSFIGTEEAQKLVEASAGVIDALDKDETIV